MKLIVTGSIAYDYLMSFPGKFTEHFLAEHMQRVSLSFLVDSMDKRRGGCAPNIAYTLALVTDYDCWHPQHDAVTVEMIIGYLMQNAKMAQDIIAGAVGRLPYERTCECASALQYALVTRPEAMSPQVKKDLAPIIGKYVGTRH